MCLFTNRRCSLRGLPSCHSVDTAERNVFVVLLKMPQQKNILSVSLVVSQNRYSFDMCAVKAKWSQLRLSLSISILHSESFHFLLLFQ